IREEKGFTYGIYSSMASYQHGGSLIIHTEAGREVSEPATKEIFLEMDDLCKNRIPEEELLLVKNYLLINLLGNLNVPYEIMQRWKNLILNRQTEADFNKNISIYKSVNPENLLELAQKYFQKEDLYQVVVI